MAHVLHILSFFQVDPNLHFLQSLQNGRKHNYSLDDYTVKYIYIYIFSKEFFLQFIVLIIITQKYQTQFVFISMEVIRKKILKFY